VLNRGGACRSEFSTDNLECLLSTSGDPIHHGIIPAHSVSVFKADGYYLPRETQAQIIDQLAKQSGIIDSYRDISGRIHKASLQTKQALLKALDVDLDEAKPSNILSSEQTEARSVYGADKLRRDGGCWGVTAALYALRSERNFGVGDFEDLARLAEIMAAKGADFVGINPVHALFPSAPHLYAPYSPSSRRFLNVMLIAPDRIEDLQDAGFKPTKPLDSEHIDYNAVYKAKMSAFEKAFALFSKLRKSSARRKSFDAFVEKSGKALKTHALFDTLFDTLPTSKQNYDGWQNFPEKYESPNSKASQSFAQEHADRIEFYTYLQWVAHEQLKSAQARAIRAGMSIGIYLDFAVGVVPGGSDVWQNKTAFAEGVSLGAPGDMANPDGQVWNLAPFNPHELMKHDFEPYRSALRQAMSLGGAIRIDHILGHLRSFWIPEGETGGYVRYPFEGLLSMIADESQRQNCMVFGEDLGTVPDGFRDLSLIHISEPTRPY